MERQTRWYRPTIPSSTSSSEDKPKACSTPRSALAGFSMSSGSLSTADARTRIEASFPGMASPLPSSEPSKTASMSGNANAMQPGRPRQIPQSAVGAQHRERVDGHRVVRAADQRVHVKRGEPLTELQRQRGHAGDRAYDRVEIRRGRTPDSGQQAGGGQHAGAPPR